MGKKVTTLRKMKSLSSFWPTSKNVTTAISRILSTPWNIGRWIRLAIGVAFLFDAYYKNSEIVAFMGAFLVYQAVFNTGCGLGASNCAVQENAKFLPDISHNFIQLNKK